MLKRFRPSVGSGHVIALIALFAALGGGYAMAFSGSGSLQKASLLGPSSSFTTVRSLTGTGNIKAKCAAGELEWQFQNLSGKSLVLNQNRGATGGAATVTTLGLGNNATTTISAVAGHSMILQHSFPDNGSKSPQAQISISLNELPNCANSSITVLALNTQQ